MAGELGGLVDEAACALLAGQDPLGYLSLPPLEAAVAGAVLERAVAIDTERRVHLAQQLASLLVGG